MLNKRLAVAVGGLIVVAGLGVGAWATGLIFGVPSLSAWAARVCVASAIDATQDTTWQTVNDRFGEAILLLEEGELPGGTEEFHAAVIAGLRHVRVQVNGFARADPGGGFVQMLDDLQRISDSQPRGPSTDAALSMLYGSIRESEALIRNASASLPDQSRSAIEQMPGCADRLLS